VPPSAARGLQLAPGISVALNAEAALRARGDGARRTEFAAAKGAPDGKRSRGVRCSHHGSSRVGEIGGEYTKSAEEPAAGFGRAIAVFCKKDAFERQTRFPAMGGAQQPRARRADGIWDTAVRPGVAAIGRAARERKKLVVDGPFGPEVRRGRDEPANRSREVPGAEG